MSFSRSMRENSQRTRPAAPCSRALGAWVGLVACLIFAVQPVFAKIESPAYVLVDASNGTVFAAENAGQLRYPASLTKLMTLYLAFAAIAEGKVEPDAELTVSANAAGQQGSRLGLREGQKIPLEVAIKSLIVRSANDSAVAIAEHLAGSESGFAEQMTAAAERLGMSATRFRNATGLTAPGHLSTARDIAILVLAIRKRFPDRYPLFGLRQLRWAGETLATINGFLSYYPGAEGLKTGFTCPAGYNLAAAAERDGQSAIAVIMGTAQPNDRNALAARLMNKFFDAETERSGIPLSEIPTLESPAPDFSGAVCLSAGRGGTLAKAWALEVAHGHVKSEVYRTLARAHQRLAGSLGGGSRVVVARALGGVPSYRGLIAGLAEKRAVQSCRAIRSRGDDCLVLTPAMVQSAFETERRLRRRVGK